MALQHSFTTLFFSLLIAFLSSSFQPLASSSSSPFNHRPRFPTTTKPPRSQARAIEAQAPDYRYETRYFTQQLDHFSFLELPTFQQRYLINTEHWVGPQRLGPIFFYCGNEGDIVWFAENTGFVWEIAQQFGAMVVFPEHRYYGESVPYGSREEAYKNATTLSYLTAEQALADFAVLITDLKQNLSATDSPVVLFGGSYGGMLAAWMRLKYPHIAIGALAASAPILQFEDIVPLETFYDIVSSDFKRESSTCFNYIKHSWNEIASIGQTRNGLVQLSNTFHFCQPLNKTDDLWNWLESAYSYLAMVDYPYPANFMMPLPGHPIKEVCKRIDGQPAGTSLLERIYEGANVYYNYTGETKCFQLDEDPHGLSGWNWQACTEMVMPMSCDPDSSMFPPYKFNYSAYEEGCIRSYGVKPRPKWITTERWACKGTAIVKSYKIDATLKKFGSNLIFSNGLLDPWSGGSVLQNISESVVALVTEEGAHHLDLRASTQNDPDWLVEQRATEILLIKGWITEYHQKNKVMFDM